jgi:uncharacterized protein YkwD
MHPLEWSDGLALAARDLCMDIAFTGSDSFISSNGNNLKDRLSYYGSPGYYTGEVMSLGPTDAKDIIIDLLNKPDFGPQGTSASKVLSRDFDVTGIFTC